MPTPHSAAADTPDDEEPAEDDAIGDILADDEVDDLEDIDDDATHGANDADEDKNTTATGTVAETTVAKLLAADASRESKRGVLTVPGVEMGAPRGGSLVGDSFAGQI